MDNTIPTTAENLGGLMRMPLDVHANLSMGLDALENARRLPVPDDDTAVGIARYHVAHVGREVEAARVACDEMAAEDLLVLPAEVCVWFHDLDLIVHGLEGQVAAVV